MIRRGDFGISIEQVDGFGKNPSLFIHNKNTAVKVASFGNKEKADAFKKYLEWIVFPNAEKPKGVEE